MSATDTWARAGFGFAVGVAAFAGVSLLRDSAFALQRRGQLPWRVYLVEAVSAAGSSARPSASTSMPRRSRWWRRSSIATSAPARPAASRLASIPFLSKWGFINLGKVTGGASLLFAEALAGVI